MGIFCVIDVSISMLTPEESLSESTYYKKAVDLLCHLLEEAEKLKSEHEVTIYRGTKKLEVSTHKKVRKALESDSSLERALAFGDFFKTLSEIPNFQESDTILLFTDARVYKADINYYPPCNTRFVIVSENSDEIDAKLLTEFVDLTKASLDEVSTKVRKDRFVVLNRSQLSSEDVVATLVRDHFTVDLLTLSFGYFTQKFKLSPHCPQIPMDVLTVVGFTTSMNLVNTPTVSHHRVTAVRRPKRKTSSPPNPKPGSKRPSPPDADNSSEGSETPTKSKQEDDDSGDELAFERRVKKERKKRRVKHRYLRRRLRVIRRMRVCSVLIDMLKDVFSSSEDLVALCRYKTGQFAVLHAVSDENEASTLVLTLLPREKCDFQPDFNDLVIESVADEEEEDGDSLGTLLHNNTKSGVPPSYDCNYQCWTSSQGINGDVQKLIRLMKKLPEKQSMFYQEVNRIRNYAIVLGMYDFLKEMARIIEKEASSLSEAARKHAKHVVRWYEKGVDISEDIEVPML